MLRSKKGAHNEDDEAKYLVQKYLRMIKYRVYIQFKTVLMYLT